MIRPRIVASYTTIPSRYDILKRSIGTMIDQTYPLDCIYVTIPKYSKRLKKEYPPIPEDLASICTIIRCDDDFGPITKLYGALITETDPDTCIISCDDDVIFPNNFVQIMIDHHTIYPKSVICGTGALISKGLICISIVSTLNNFHKWSGLTGFKVGKQGRCVDLIFGVAGVLYFRGAFPPNDLLYDEILQYSLKDDSIFHNDDVLISGYLSKHKIERRIFFDIPSIKQGGGNDALSASPNMISRLHQSINKAQAFGFFTNMENCPIDETIIYKIIIFIILLIIICILSIYYYKFIQ